MKWAMGLMILGLLGCQNPGLTPDFPRHPGDTKLVIFFQAGTNAPLPGITMDIKLDGKLIAGMRVKHRIEARIAPGLHTVSILNSTLAVDLKVDQTCYLRYSAEIAGGTIYQVPSAEAESMLKATVLLNQ
jgi:hypothetical protein